MARKTKNTFGADAEMTQAEAEAEVAAAPVEAPKRAPRRNKAEQPAAEKGSRARLDRKTIDLIVKLRNNGLGVVRIARELEKRGIKTATGKTTWHGPNVRQVLARELGDDAWAASVASVKETRRTEDTSGETEGQ